jgi:hypothetical protein
MVGRAIVQVKGFDELYQAFEDKVEKSVKMTT